MLTCPTVPLLQGGHPSSSFTLKNSCTLAILQMYTELDRTKFGACKQALHVVSFVEFEACFRSETATTKVQVTTSGANAKQ